MKFFIMISGIILLVYGWLFSKKRYWLDPIRINCTTWAIALLIYALNYEYFKQFKMQFLLIVISGCILFGIGAIIGKKVAEKKVYKKKMRIRSKNIIKVSIVVCLGITMIYILKSVEAAKEFEVGNFLMNLRLAKNYGSANLDKFEYVGVYANSVLAYILIYRKEIKIKKIFFIINFFVVIVFAILGTGRGFIFNSILMCLGIYNFECIDRNEKGKFLKVLISVSLIMIIIFSSYNIILKKGSSSKEITAIEKYIGGNLQSLDYYLEKNNEWKYGENSFRFLLKLKSKILNEEKDYSLIDQYPEIENSNNTYTLYKMYIEDFGYFGCLIQVLIGFITAKLFWSGVKGSKISRYFSIQLIFPLVMQIMLDQYLSLTSYWIQVILYGILLFKLNCYIEKGDEEDERNYFSRWKWDKIISSNKGNVKTNGANI
ncbi:MAG: O-antigen polymerase [Clostridium sp.]